MKKQHKRLIAGTVAMLPWLSLLWAGTITWDGGPSGTGTNWNDAVNWGGDIKPGASDGARLSATGTSSGKVLMLGASQLIDLLAIDGFTYALTIGSAADAASGFDLTLNHVYRNSNMNGIQTLAADLVLATNSVWDIANGYGGNLTVTRAIRGSAMTLEKNNNGTLILGGTNTYSGTTRLRQGTLELGFNQSSAPLTNILSSTAPLTVMNGTVTLRGKSSALNCQTVNGLAVNPGSTTFNIVDANSANKTRMAFGGITRTTGGTVNFVQPTGNTTVSADNGYVTTNANDASGILGAYATVGSVDWAANDGVNIVAYSGYATLSGNSPNLSDNAASNVRLSNASTGTVGLAASAVTVNSLLCNDAATRTLTIGPGSTLRLGAAGGILTPSGTGALTLDGGTLTAGGADNTAGEVIFQNATTVTNTAVIADNGSGAVALTKTGGGLLLLTAACAYSGGTVMNAGTLTLPGGANPLNTNGSVLVTGGALNLGGSVQTNAGSFTIAGGVLTNGTLVKVGSGYAAQAGSIYAKLDGAVGLTKTGAGSLTLAASNGYTGDTVVKEGTVNATVGGSTKGNIMVGASDGVMPAVFNGSAVDAVANTKDATVYRNGSFTLGNGDNMNNLTVVGGYANSAYGYINGTITMTGGTFGGNVYGNHSVVTTLACDTTAIVSAGNSMSGSFDHTFTVADGNAPIDLSVTGGMSGGAAGKKITKWGVGVMAISGSGNTFTFGNFYVNAGTLLANTTAGSATGAALVTVGTNAVLGGIGFIGGVANFSNANVTVAGSAAGAVTNRATVAPGSIDAVTGAHVIGTLTVGSLAVQTNNVTFGAYSTLKINIATNGACDKLVVNGTLSLITTTDTLEMDVADASALKPGTYTLVTCQQFAAGADQAFTTVVGKPARGRLEYTSTNLNYVIAPKGTLTTIL